MEIIQLDIEGMTCASCVGHVEKGLIKSSGVDTAAVNLATDKATVSYDPDKVSPEGLIKLVEEAGYGAALTEEQGREEKKRSQERRLLFHFIVAASLSTPLLLAMFAGLFGLEFLMFLHNPLLQLILATPVQFWIGARYYKGAFHSLKAGSPGMDVLVALGTSSAYFFSVFNGFLAERLGVESSGLYFEASAVIITLVLLGKYLEARAKGRTGEAIRKLMGLQPKNARVERLGEIVLVPISDVEPEDIVLVRPGDRVPADGRILTGSSALDESLVTGESLPIEKGPGDKVTGGTVNTYGAFKFMAEEVGKNTVLARIIRIVEEAQGSKAPIQRLADKVAAVFVPAVLGIAVLTFFLWWLTAGDVTQALISSVAVLVIACPCALGLATPTAVMVGTGMGAGRGILIRNGEILQTAGKLTALVLDKTGTITQGKPELMSLVPLEDLGLREEDYLCLAAALEEPSEHPLGRAIAEAARNKGLVPGDADEFQSMPGKGISARLRGKLYFIGTEAFIQSKGVDTQSAAKAKARLEEKGETAVILSDETAPLALFSIADGIKEHSAEGIRLLKDLGLEVFMITGDNERTARAIAQKAGISQVLAGVLPEGKADEIKKLQEKGFIVGMAGDGVNDAPGLTEASVGIAMGEGSDIAMESADITLMRGDLREIAASIRLSRRTMGKIRQNLFWAFFYNAIGIPFAALGFLNPMIAGAAMAFSSVTVVSNSLSLKRFNPAKDFIQRGQNIYHPEEEKHMTETIKVSGMNCHHCKRTVEEAAKAVEGVQNAEVSLERSELSLSFSGDKGDLEAVRTAVLEAGYQPE